MPKFVPLNKLARHRLGKSVGETVTEIQARMAAALAEIPICFARNRAGPR